MARGWYAFNLTYSCNTYKFVATHLRLWGQCKSSGTQCLSSSVSSGIQPRSSRSFSNRPLFLGPAFNPSTQPSIKTALIHFLFNLENITPTNTLAEEIIMLKITVDAACPPTERGVGKEHSRHRPVTNHLPLQPSFVYTLLNPQLTFSNLR